MKALTAAFVLLAATAGAQSDAPPAPPGQVELLEIPFPDMEGLEEAVVEQLNDAYSDLVDWQRQEGAAAADLAAVYGRLGQLLDAYDLDVSAAVAYTDATRLLPEDPRWRYYLARLQHENGDFAAAEEGYRAVLGRVPDDLAARVHLGEVLFAENRLDEAAAELERALAVAPGDPAALSFLGQVEQARGQNARAVELLTAALEKVPAADRLHYNLAMALRGLGEMDKARQHLGLAGKVGIKVRDPLADALEELATGERVHLLRGRQAFAAGRWADAAEEFKKALEADPRSVRARVNLGSALGQMGDVPAALAEFRTALEVNPRNATAHFNVGTILASQGWDEEAVSHFEKAIELNYTDSASHLELGRLLRRLGRRDEALEHLREAVSMEPRNETTWVAEAAALVDAGRYKEAVERLEEGHRILPSAGHLAHALARLLAGSPDPELRDGERALELASAVFAAQKTAQHAATVALALAELDRCDEASTWQQEVVRAATESGNESWAAAERQALERYLAGPPCR